MHSGGKRKLHEFRSLYDYYGKRIDYGGGEFPSKWPTEIEQDEMSGWFLRIVPHRKPAESIQEWDVYLDSQENSDTTTTRTPRRWYYNRNTKYSTYLPPAVVDQDHEISQSTWQKYYDTENKVYYYYNEDTQESTYDRPINFSTPREIEPITKDGWTQYYDNNTQQYYYTHPDLVESTFEVPSAFIA